MRSGAKARGARDGFALGSAETSVRRPTTVRVARSAFCMVDGVLLSIEAGMPAWHLGKRPIHADITATWSGSTSWRRSIVNQCNADCLCWCQHQLKWEPQASACLRDQ